MEDDRAVLREPVELMTIGGSRWLAILVTSLVAGAALGGVIDSLSLGLALGFATPFVVPAAVNDLAIHRAAARARLDDL